MHPQDLLISANTLQVLYIFLNGCTSRLANERILEIMSWTQLKLRVQAVLPKDEHHFKPNNVLISRISYVGGWLLCKRLWPKVRTCTLSAGRMTFPYWSSCGTTFRTVSIPMAKPTPADVPEAVYIAVLTPITRPAESSSGPPELPI